MDVRDELVLLRDGSLRSLVEVESVNFDLKSKDEQTAIILGFQDFLNALDFPLQILIKSRHLDIAGYLALVDEGLEKITNELLKMQMSAYRKFVSDLTELAHIMNKKFYAVIPYYAVETPANAGRGIGATLKGLLGSTKKNKLITEEDFQAYQPQMGQRISIIMAGLTPLGLKVRVVTGDELVKTYYGYYNS